MRGSGEFQRGQTTRDALVPELFRSLRQVIDILERLTIEARSARPDTIKPSGSKDSQPPLPSLALAYSIKDVAKQTGVSRSRIYQAIGSSELRATKCGKRTLIQRKDLQAWIESWPTVS